MVKDLILKNGDLDIKNGDLVIDYSDQQHIEDLLVSEKGDFKQSPLTGIGLLNYINAPLTKENRLALEKEIRLQLLADGFEIKQVEIGTEGSVNIDAEIVE